MRKQRTGWRRFRRVIPSPSAPVRVDVAIRDELEVEASDISEGGMELRYTGEATLQVDDSLTLLLHLPLEAPVRARAKIRHIDASRIGLVFTDLTASGREALRRYVLTSSAERSVWHRLRQLWQE